MAVVILILTDIGGGGRGLNPTSLNLSCFERSEWVLLYLVVLGGFLFQDED